MYVAMLPDMAWPLSRYTTGDEIGGKDFSFTRSLAPHHQCYCPRRSPEGTLWVLSIAGVGGLLESDLAEHARLRW